VKHIVAVPFKKTMKLGRRATGRLIQDQLDYTGRYARRSSPRLMTAGRLPSAAKALCKWDGWSSQAGEP
jgi:hypothetical protein